MTNTLRNQPRSIRPLLVGVVASALLIGAVLAGGAGRLFAGGLPTNPRAAANEVNLAAYGAASQSSTGWGGDAGRAIDGDTDGNFSHGSVTHTKAEAHPHWDLSINHQISSISNIEIYNRTDCCSDRLNDIEVQVSTQPFDRVFPQIIDGEVPKYFSTRIQTSPTGDRISVAVDWETPSDQVFIRIRNAGDSKYLSIAEVQVWGVDGDVATTT